MLKIEIPDSSYEEVVEETINSFPFSKDEVSNKIEIVEHKPAEIQLEPAFVLFLIVAKPAITNLLLAAGGFVGVVWVTEALKDIYKWGKARLFGKSSDTEELSNADKAKILDQASKETYKWFKEDFFRKLCEEEAKATNDKFGVQVKVSSEESAEVDHQLSIKYYSRVMDVQERKKHPLDYKKFQADFYPFELIVRPVIGEIRKDSTINLEYVNASVGLGQSDPHWSVLIKKTDGTTLAFSISSNGSFHDETEQENLIFFRKILESNPPFVTDEKTKYFHWRTCPTIDKTSISIKPLFDYEEGKKRGLKPCVECIRIN